MHCVVSWNNEKSETIGDVIRVFKDSEGYWDFDSVTSENEYWNMKSNSEMINFEEFSNAQDYVTFREYRDSNYGEINIDYSYCAPVVTENEFDNNQLLNQNFMPTYLGGSYMPMNMPYGEMVMPPVISPLIPIPIFIGGTLIGWHRNNLFFGRRFMPGFGGMNFIRSGLWNSMNYALRTRRYGSPRGLMYMDNFARRSNRLPSIGYSMDSNQNNRWDRFGTRRNRFNVNRFRKSRAREHNKFGRKKINNFNGQNNRKPNFNRQNNFFNQRPNLSNRKNNNFNINNQRQPKRFENRQNMPNQNPFGRKGKPVNVKVRQNMALQNFQQQRFPNLRNVMQNNGFQMRNQMRNQMSSRFFNRSFMNNNRNTFINRQNSRNFASQFKATRPRNPQRNNFRNFARSSPSRANKGRRG